MHAVRGENTEKYTSTKSKIALKKKEVVTLKRCSSFGCIMHMSAVRCSAVRCSFFFRSAFSSKGTLLLCNEANMTRDPKKQDSPSPPPGTFLAHASLPLCMLCAWSSAAVGFFIGSSTKRNRVCACRGVYQRLHSYSSSTFMYFLPFSLLEILGWYHVYAGNT